MTDTIATLAMSTRDTANRKVAKWIERESSAKSMVSAINSWHRFSNNGNAVRVMDAAVQMLQDHPRCINTEQIICFMAKTIADNDDYTASEHMRHALSIAEIETTEKRLIREHVQMTKRVEIIVNAWATAPRGDTKRSAEEVEYIMSQLFHDDIPSDNSSETQEQGA